LGFSETFGEEELEKMRKILIDEATQLRKIFSAMLTKL